MTRRFVLFIGILCRLGLLFLLILAMSPCLFAAEPSASAMRAFNSYSQNVEARLVRQHGTPQAFLAPQDWTRLQKGDLIVEKVTPSGRAELPGALLHHWRGTAFVPGARLADFERLMKDFNGYPRLYAPQVLQANVAVRGNDGDRFQGTLRVRQHHVITVVMDTVYDIMFVRVDPQHGYSISRSSRISEIVSAGTNKERALTADEQHGFLWQMNTYWSYEERDGGLYMQIESVSLSRSVPTGLGWVVGPFVESIPRESLEFTLHATCDALRKQAVVRLNRGNRYRDSGTIRTSPAQGAPGFLLSPGSTPQWTAATSPTRDALWHWWRFSFFRVRAGSA
jgi:hypothetical protein